MMPPVVPRNMTTNPQDLPCYINAENLLCIQCLDTEKQEHVLIWCISTSPNVVFAKIESATPKRFRLEGFYTVANPFLGLTKPYAVIR